MQRITICCRGHLDRDWAKRLYSLSLSHSPEGNTILSGELRDQAELRGILTYLSDLGLELLSVNASEA